MSFIAGFQFNRLVKPAILAIGLCALGASAALAQTGERRAGDDRRQRAR